MTTEESTHEARHLPELAASRRATIRPAASPRRVEQVRLIRSLGFDSIWAGEHHVTPGFHFFPQLALLQRLAAEAEGLWIGTNVTLLPLHNPVELAEVGAFMDVITGGKFLLGVGLGYRPEEYAIYGVPMSERVSRLRRGRRDHHAAVDRGPRHAPGTPLAVQRRHHPPAPAAVAAPAHHHRRAGARRPSSGPPPSATAGWWCRSRRSISSPSRWRPTTSARSAAELPPSPHVCRLLEVGCAPDDETAVRRVAPFLIEKYKAYFSWGLEGLTLDPNATPEQQFRSLAANRFAVGSPAKVTDMLLAQHRAGITHLSMRVSWPGMGQDDILAGIELLGTPGAAGGAAADWRCGLNGGRASPSLRKRGRGLACRAQ